MTSIRDRIKEILVAPREGHPADDLLAEFVIIHRSELPATTRNPAGNIEVEGVDHSVWPVGAYTADRARSDAMDYLAAAEAIESTLAEFDREQARRDELAAEFTAVNSYNGQLPYTQKLIDRIIELERTAS